MRARALKVRLSAPFAAASHGPAIPQDDSNTALQEPGLPVASAIALHETTGGALVVSIRHAMRPPLAEATRSYAEALLGFLAAHDLLRDLPADWLLQAAGDVP